MEARTVFPWKTVRSGPISQ